MCVPFYRRALLYEKIGNNQEALIDLQKASELGHSRARLKLNKMRGDTLKITGTHQPIKGAFGIEWGDRLTLDLNPRQPNLLPGAPRPFADQYQWQKMKPKWWQIDPPLRPEILEQRFQMATYWHK